MNTITIIVAVLVLWLVTGLGFLTAYFDARRKNKTAWQTWTCNEALLFVASVALPLLVALFRAVN